jgi:hypothetical protein
LTTTRPIGVPSIGDSRVTSPGDCVIAAAAAAIVSFDIAVEVEGSIDISV